MKNTLSIRNVLLTYLLFLAVWTLRVILLKPLIDGNFELWTKAMVEGAVKSIIWFGFAAFLIKLYKENLNIGFKEMFAARIKAQVFLPVFGIFTAYYVVAMFVLHGGFYLNPAFHPSQLIGQFLLVGILEEIVFRGWFLNAFSLFLKDWKANIITSVMFVLIHFPSWLAGGMNITALLSAGAGIFVLSMIFGWTFEKNKSLWTPIVLHMVWDILSITVL